MQPNAILHQSAGRHSKAIIAQNLLIRQKYKHKEEEEENGPQTLPLLRPSTHFPPSISEQLRNRHRRSPRGVSRGRVSNAAKFQTRERNEQVVDGMTSRLSRPLQSQQACEQLTKLADDGDNPKKGETGGIWRLEVRKLRPCKRLQQFAAALCPQTWCEKGMEYRNTAKNSRNLWTKTTTQTSEHGQNPERRMQSQELTEMVEDGGNPNLQGLGQRRKPTTENGGGEEPTARAEDCNNPNRKRSTRALQQ